MRKSLSKSLIDLGAIASKTKGRDPNGNPDIATGLHTKSMGLERE